MEVKPVADDLKTGIPITALQPGHQIVGANGSLQTIKNVVVNKQGNVLVTTDKGAFTMNTNAILHMAQDRAAGGGAWHWETHGKTWHLLDASGRVLGKVVEGPLGYGTAFINGTSKWFLSAINAVEYVEKETNVARAADYNALDPKGEQFAHGSKVHNSRGVTGEVIHVDGNFVYVSVDGKRQKWELNRTFRAADVIEPVPVDDTTYATPPNKPAPYKPFGFTEEQLKQTLAPKDPAGFNKQFEKDFTPKGHNCDACGRQLSDKDYDGYGSWSYKCPSCKFKYNHNSSKTASEQMKAQGKRAHEDDSINGELEANVDVAVEPVEVHDAEVTKDTRQIGLPKSGGSYLGNQISRWIQEELPKASESELRAVIANDPGGSKANAARKELERREAAGNDARVQPV